MLPKTLTRAVSRLSRPRLIELRDLIDDLLAALETPPEPPTRQDREVVQRKEMGHVTYQLERVRCGKACRGCPHGPYWYAYYRSGGKVVSKYIGKNFQKID